MHYQGKIKRNGLNGVEKSELTQASSVYKILP